MGTAAQGDISHPLGSQGEHKAELQQPNSKLQDKQPTEILKVLIIESFRLEKMSETESINPALNIFSCPSNLHQTETSVCKSSTSSAQSSAALAQG